MIYLHVVLFNFAIYINVILLFRAAERTDTYTEILSKMNSRQKYTETNKHAHTNINTRKHSKIAKMQTYYACKNLSLIRHLNLTHEEPTRTL